MKSSASKNRAHRKSQPSGGWITARKTVQILSLLAFLILFILAQRGGLPGELANLPMRLDPLAMLATTLASRVILAGSALALVTLLLTLVFGRAWCGWICPLGTLLDLIPLTRWRGKRRAPPEGWRGVKYVLLLITLVAALLGNLTLLFFDPLAMLFRALTVSVWPALDQIVTAIEAALYRVPALSEVVSTFDGWIRPGLLPPEPLYFRGLLLITATFLGVILLNIFAQRFWCRYLCPLGAFLGILSKFAIYRREVGPECKGCTLCSAACPTGTIDPVKGYASDPGECTACMDCLEVCPRKGIAFKPTLAKAAWNHYDPDRRQALFAIGAAVTGVALFHNQALAAQTESGDLLPPRLIRPPGALQANADILELSRCIRCAECLRTCPTNALQPAVFEAGLAGFGTPVLIPRLGYCDYSCNACGQVCPVGSIPLLSLDEKRQTVIGKAYIDQDRCLAWSDHTPCIVCEEMCPLPDKAIWLEEAEVLEADGRRTIIQLPHVLREDCIGCGICEYKCPVSSEAAIQIYSAPM